MKIAVSVKTTDQLIQLPEYKTAGAAGFDLAVDKEYVIEPGQWVQVSTGLIIQTPPNHMLMLVPRSSLYKKHGLVLTNSVGIIDEDYAGEGDIVQLSLMNAARGYHAVLKPGERVAQGIFVPVTRADFTRNFVPKETRGGWGSTG
jgi:dUTP pyrophosphatase